MTKNHFSTIRVCHMLMMLLFAIGNLGVALVLLFTTLPALHTGTDAWKSYLGILIAAGTCNALALGFGIAYLWRGYSKRAAGFYKGFLLLSAFAAVQYVSADVCRIATPPADIAPLPLWMIALRIALMCAKVALLIALVFVKDLGKQKSLLLFWCILGIDLVYGLLKVPSGSTVLFLVLSVVGRLLLTGTIGLAIKGKYDDKDERGTT